MTKSCWFCDGEGDIRHTLTREEQHFAHPFSTVCPQCGGTGIELAPEEVHQQCPCGDKNCRREDH